MIRRKKKSVSTEPAREWRYDTRLTGAVRRPKKTGVGERGTKEMATIAPRIPPRAGENRVVEVPVGGPMVRPISSGTEEMPTTLRGGGQRVYRVVPGPVVAPIATGRKPRLLCLFYTASESLISNGRKGGGGFLRFLPTSIAVSPSSRACRLSAPMAPARSWRERCRTSFASIVYNERRRRPIHLGRLDRVDSQVRCVASNVALPPLPASVNGGDVRS